MSGRLNPRHRVQAAVLARRLQDALRGLRGKSTRSGVADRATAFLTRLRAYWLRLRDMRPTVWEWLLLGLLILLLGVMLQTPW